jgi:hypothetical protein
MGRVDASGGEWPDTLDHPAAVDLSCRARHSTAGATRSESSIAHPRRFVYRRDDVLGKGCAPLVATGGGPDHPAGCPATRSECAVDVKQLASGEVCTAVPARSGQAEDSSGVEPLNGVLRNTVLVFGHGLVIAQPGLQLLDAGEDVLSARLLHGCGGARNSGVHDPPGALYSSEAVTVVVAIAIGDSSPRTSSGSVRDRQSKIRPVSCG